MICMFVMHDDNGEVFVHPQKEVFKKSTELFELDWVSDTASDSGAFNSKVYNAIRKGVPTEIKVTEGSEYAKMANKTLKLVLFLSQLNSPVRKPIMSINNRHMIEVLSNGIVYTVSAYEKLKGEAIQGIPVNTWPDSHFVRLGFSLAHLHNAMEKYYMRTNAQEWPTWYDGYLPRNVQIEVQKNMKIEDKYVVIMDKLRKFSRQKPCGFNHGNLTLNNSRYVKDSHFAFVNFENSMRGWPLMDVAHLLFNALLSVDGDEKRTAFSKRFLKHTLTGYKPIRKYELKEYELIKDFVNFFEIRYYAYYEFNKTMYKDAVAQKYMENRAEKIADGIPLVKLW